MIKISKRLSHLADMVSKDVVLADVGTDHGYIPIYLLQTGKIKQAFAMDIGKGPLLRAKEHIEACGLGDYITTRLSDGVAALKLKEADSILIAGMGGGVILHILQEGEEIITSAKELILQPQSEISKVREYLHQKGYVVDKEDMVFEDGKYYPMMHIVFEGGSPNEDMMSSFNEDLPIVYRYGAGLLKDRNKVLHQYLKHTIHQYEQILEELLKQEQTDAIVTRKEQIEEELLYAKGAFKYWEEGN